MHMQALTLQMEKKLISSNATLVMPRKVDLVTVT
jgi:hypothetical protein